MQAVSPYQAAIDIALRSTGRNAVMLREAKKLLHSYGHCSLQTRKSHTGQRRNGVTAHPASSASARASAASLRVGAATKLLLFLVAFFDKFR